MPRASKKRGWTITSPSTRKARQALYNRCGRKAFLLPDTKHPGRSKYPIITKGSRACQPDCRGLRAAKSRALQQLGSKRRKFKRGDKKRLRRVAGQAQSIAKRVGCSWAR